MLWKIKYLEAVKEAFENAPTRKDQIAIKWMLWLAASLTMSEEDRVSFFSNKTEVLQTLQRLMENLNEYRAIRTTRDNRPTPINRASNRRVLSSGATQSGGTRSADRTKDRDYQKASRDSRATAIRNTHIKRQRRKVKS